ncbi:hypothetical protein [Winogradskyella ursingii]|uniref:hypothetical protein n=1 Tax=Winogradskyella ursingii TaxID=2686079 RepID=UPI0015C97775|nr:hypothetical protein [Winogradskyella ursingii]
MKNYYLFLLILLGLAQSFGQNESLPYTEVPVYPDKFTAGTMAARMVDALGFRYYWASEGLTEKDLAYRTNEDGRSSEETLKHIYDLSEIIVNSTLKKENLRVTESLTYSELRFKTLNNLKTAADILRKSNDISQYKIIFGEQEFPFWNQVNGPIADAIWHCGQLVVLRRSTGNPINPKLNQFTGKVND